MALPTSGLTLHVDASTNSYVWTDSPPTAHPANNGEIRWWTDARGSGPDWNTNQTVKPTWRSASSEMREACLFSGYGELMNAAHDTAVSASALMGAQAKTIMLSFRNNNIDASNNHAIGSEVYLNEQLIADAGGYFGMYLRNTGTNAYVGVWTWDGAEKAREAAYTMGDSVVVTMIHDTTYLYLYVNGALINSVAAGATSDLNGQMRLFRNYQNVYSQYAEVGEIAIWNRALSGTDLADAHAVFMPKWADAATTNVSAALGGTYSTGGQTTGTPGITIAL